MVHDGDCRNEGLFVREFTGRGRRRVRTGRYSIRALRAGKHVYCEKPMAVTPAECEQMIAAARKASRQLGIGYRQHFEPYNLELIRIARARELGALKFITATAGTIPVEPKQWRLDKKLAGGGSMVDIGIYALQAVRCVAGEEPVSVSARATITDRAKFKDIDETLAFSMTFPERRRRLMRQHLRRARQPRRRRRDRNGRRGAPKRRSEPKFAEIRPRIVAS